ncbi:energy transducer TonB [Terriglobus sp. ADX1]|uniref:energy transducer TonB n=1 Tax=Terriglobus sp. ADX1 TaxID=2794063 RepID=UPI002FE50FD4
MLRSVFCLLLFVLPAAAQESAAFVAFRNHIVNQPRVLTDYSADKERKYEFRAEELSAKEPFLHEFGFFTANQVTLHGDTVSLKGERAAIIRNPSTHGLAAAGIQSPMSISVVVKDGTVDEALPAIEKLLFWSSLDEAVSSIPDYVAKNVPGNYVSKTQTVAMCTDCGPGKHVPKSDGIVKLDVKEGVIPPKLTHQVDPEIPASAHKEKPTRTSVRIGLTVGSDGKPTELWVILPAASDYALEAAKAVSQYRFEPARKDRKKVAVRLNIEVYFETF